jgi:cellulose biosynthesis protein BcsQ
MNYINNDDAGSILAIAFSGVGKLEDYLKSSKLDLCVVSENIDTDIFSNIQDVKLLYLTENRYTSPFDEDKSLYVYKYSKGQNLLDKIKDILIYSEHRFKGGLCKAYAVTSPLGRCGKTRTAMAICNADEVRGGLYMGLEAYGGIAYDEQINYTMSDILYLTKIRSEQILDYIMKSIIRIDNIYAIPSSNSCTDLYEINKEDIDWLLNKVMEWGRYTTIVWDIDGTLISNMEILNAFDKVIMPVLNDDASMLKISGFRKMLDDEEFHGLSDKLLEIYVPDTDYDSAEMIRCIERRLNNEH